VLTRHGTFINCITYNMKKVGVFVIAVAGKAIPDFKQASSKG